MKIIMGLSPRISSELDRYIQSGVDEFFLGYLSKKWIDLFGWEIGPNRRISPYANFLIKKDLKEVVDTIHKYNKKVYLTLNEHEYNPKQIRYISSILNDLSDIKIDAYIVGNLALMMAIRKYNKHTPFHISIGGGCNNIEAVRFYTRWISNIKRIIIPRKVLMTEIMDMSKNAKKMGIEVEVFGFMETCFWSDEYCFAWHSDEYGSLCTSVMNRYARPQAIHDVLLMNGKQFPKKKIQEFKKKLMDFEYSQRISRLVNVPAVELTGPLSILENDHCSLCAVQMFKEWGVDAIKVPGRGKTTEINTGLIRILKKVIKHKNATLSYCKKIIGSKEYCSGRNCYYNYPYNQ